MKKELMVYKDVKTKNKEGDKNMINKWSNIGYDFLTTRGVHWK